MNKIAFVLLSLFLIPLLTSCIHNGPDCHASIVVENEMSQQITITVEGAEEDKEKIIPGWGNCTVYQDIIVSCSAEWQIEWDYDSFSSEDEVCKAEMVRIIGFGLDKVFFLADNDFHKFINKASGWVHIPPVK
jgi:hypothetical protein